jgi:hypothetical protein
LPSYEEDIRLYKTLLDAGATVVADTHMIAASDEEGMAQVRPLLDGMLEVSGGKALLRDIWTPVNTSPDDRERWMPCIAPIVTNMHPNALRAFETRLFLNRLAK